MAEPGDNINQLSDSDLATRLSNGDIASFDELYKRHHAGVNAHCLRLVGDRSEAEDLTQEVFAELYQNTRRFLGETSVAMVLHRIALTKSNDAFRRRTRLLEIGVGGSEEIELISAMARTDLYSVAEEEIFTNLKLSSTNEIKEAQDKTFHTEEIKKAQQLLIAESAPVPRMLDTIKILLDEVGLADSPESWADVWTSATSRQGTQIDIGLVWREALIALMTGALSFDTRKALLSCLRSFGFFSAEQLLLDLQEETATPSSQTRQETASSFLADLQGLSKMGLDQLASLSPDEKFSRQQLNDIGENFSDSTKLTVTTLFFAASSFNDEISSGNSAPSKDALKTVLLLTLMTPKTKKRGLINVVHP